MLTTQCTATWKWDSSHGAQEPIRAGHWASLKSLALLEWHWIASCHFLLILIKWAEKLDHKVQWKKAMQSQWLWVAGRLIEDESHFGQEWNLALWGFSLAPLLHHWLLVEKDASVLSKSPNLSWRNGSWRNRTGWGLRLHGLSGSPGHPWLLHRIWPSLVLTTPWELPPPPTQLSSGRLHHHDTTSWLVCSLLPAIAVSLV